MIPTPQAKPEKKDNLPILDQTSEGIAAKLIVILMGTDINFNQLGELK